MSRLSKNYTKIFTPSAPLRSERFLFGRKQEFADLRHGVDRPGTHPLVIGDRGVGKTSLVRLALGGRDPHCIRVSCSDSMDFDSVARAILREVGVNVLEKEVEASKESAIEGSAAPFGLGAKGIRTDRRRVSSRGVGDTTLDPWLLYRTLRDLRRKVVIVIDEYDTIPRSNKTFHSGIAHLIKTLADNSAECDTRLIIVGVAQSAQDLLGEHQSIQRSAREIYLRPLRHADVHEFLDAAERELDMRFAIDVKDRIVLESMGYPYFVHMVGLECIDAMLARDRAASTVTAQDYRVAVRRAVQRAFRSLLGQYRDALFTMTPQERRVMQAIIEFSGTRHPTRAKLLSAVAASAIMTTDEFDHLLMQLQQTRKLIFISRRNDEVRFREPLMLPFLRSWIHRPHAGQTVTRSQRSLFESPFDDE